MTELVPILLSSQESVNLQILIQSTTSVGQLVVQREGVYYVYVAQVFFENYPDAPSIYHNRVELTINEKPIAVIQTPIGNQADYGSESSGAVLRLKKGDLIGLKTVYRSAIWLTKHHTFFGPYSINL